MMKCCVLLCGCVVVLHKYKGGLIIMFFVGWASRAPPKNTSPTKCDWPFSNFVAAPHSGGRVLFLFTSCMCGKDSPGSRTIHSHRLPSLHSLIRNTRLSTLIVCAKFFIGWFHFQFAAHSSRSKSPEDEKGAALLASFAARRWRPPPWHRRKNNHRNNPAVESITVRFYKMMRCITLMYQRRPWWF